MTYRAPLEEISLTLTHMFGADALAGTELFAEATVETRDAILTEAAKLAEEVLAPLNRVGDLDPCRIENGVVRLPKGFVEGFAAIRDGGWMGLTAEPRWGGMGLPHAFFTAFNEMTSSACLALALGPLLTIGKIEALQEHAPDWVRDLYIPKLASGEWTGVMDLTEPGAGSDVGALRLRAEPAGDGTYRLHGQKIFITWGDHDAAENVCHLVLGRIAGAPDGVRGVSMFLCPKFIPEADGTLGPRNAMRAIGLEHKMGLHGSPTCVMEFDGAAAWLIGGENRGLMAMFSMMNAARLGVGVQGVGVAEAALQAAEAYAQARRQGRTPVGDGHGPIADHADVRRMLTTMRARTMAARAICFACATALDFARAAPEAERAGWAARAGLLTPIAKAFGTDVGCEVASLGIQVHGGMGYVEETGVAQFYRDVRVTPIYEGANGVQAMDLVGRKLAQHGAAPHAMLDEIAAFAAQVRSGAGAELAARLDAARAQVLAATDWMIAAKGNDRHAGATPFLRAWALLLGGYFLFKGAEAAPKLMPLASFFIRQELPQAAAHLAAATEGAGALYPEIETEDAADSAAA